MAPMNIVLLDALTFGETDLSGFDTLGEVIVHQTTSPSQNNKQRCYCYKQSCYR